MTGILTCTGRFRRVRSRLRVVYKCLARPCAPSTCSRAIRRLSYLRHPSAHFPSRSTHRLDPGLSTSSICVFVLPHAWCLVATWIIELYRHGYELLQLSLAILGLNLSLRRRSSWQQPVGARTTILVSPAFARSPVPSAGSTAAPDMLALSPVRLCRSHTLSTLLRADVILRIFVALTFFCGIVVFTGVTVAIRSPSLRRRLCWSSFPALCPTGPLHRRLQPLRPPQHSYSCPLPSRHRPPPVAHTPMPSVRIAVPATRAAAHTVYSTVLQFILVHL